MYVVGKIFAVQNGNNELVLDFPGGVLNFYRINAGQLEFSMMSPGKWGQNLEWRQLTAADIMQHFVLRTPVADWLRDRVRLVPIDEVRQEVYGDMAAQSGRPGPS